MPKRAIDSKQRAWLLDQLNVWRRDTLISEEQARRIADSYEGAGELAERGRSKAVFVLMAAAATLVGLAALLLIGYNWDQLDRLTKLAMILGTIGATHAIGFTLRYKRNARSTSEIIFFLGCLFYGAGIWLVAQTFHLSAHYPDGLWWWAVGVLPFAWFLETRLLHALVVAILAVWVGQEILNFAYLGAWIFGRWNVLPNAAYSLPLLALPGIVWAYRKQSVQTLSLYIPLLAWWTILQAFAWKIGPNPIYFVGGVGALLLVIAERHAEGSRFAIPYRYYGSLLVGGSLVPLSFYDLGKHLGGASSNLVLPPALLALASLAVGMSRDRKIPERQRVPLGIALLMVLLPLIATGSAAPGGAGNGALLSTVLVNLAMLGGAFWLMQVGLREERGRPFSAGVLYFLLWAVLRYVDLFGGVGGMVGAAMMFFGCGAVLFAVARYWQGRKEVRYA
jgi:predicted membrane protein DUF2157